MTDEKNNPGSEMAVLDTVLGEIRGFREENAKEHENVIAMLSKRMNGIDGNVKEIQGRTRSLELWRAYILGIGAAVAVGASWLFNKVFR